MVKTQKKSNSTRDAKQGSSHTETSFPPTLDAKLFLEKQKFGTLAWEGEEAGSAYGVRSATVSQAYADALFQEASEKQRDHRRWAKIGIVLKTNGILGSDFESHPYGNN